MAVNLNNSVSATVIKKSIRLSSGYQDNFFFELMKSANVSKTHHLTVDATSATIGVAQVAPSNSKKPITIVVYPTIAPEKIVIPIVTCIFGFPLLALLVICCLRHRAKAARERERRRTANLGTDRSAISLVRFSPMHKLGVYLAGGSQPTTTQNSGRRNRSASVRSERSMSRHFQSLELDTVIEEKNSEPDIESVIISNDDKLSINGS